MNTIRNVPLWLARQIQPPIRALHDEDISSKCKNFDIFSFVMRQKKSIWVMVFVFLVFTTEPARKPFQIKVNERQMQAKRSIFVQVDNDTNSIRELLLHCTRIGKVQNIYRTDRNANAYFLIEFNHPSTANDVIRSSFHSGNHMIDGKVRVHGRFLYFNAKHDTIIKRNPCAYKRDTSLTNQESIFKAMRNEKTMDQQIMTLYKVNRLSSFSSRLRFLTALQMEEAICGMIHEAKILPFGSSINGFGTMDSDLDMVLVSGCNKSTKSQFSAIELGQPDFTSRAHIRNNLYVMSVIARNWLQGVNDVTNVLHARVPIIKYVQELTQLECDLSACNA